MRIAVSIIGCPIAPSRAIPPRVVFSHGRALARRRGRQVITDTNPDRAAAESWQAAAEVKEKEAKALMAMVVELITAAEAHDQERLAALAAESRVLLRQILDLTVEGLASEIEAGDPDWLDKLRAEGD